MNRDLFNLIYVEKKEFRKIFLNLFLIINVLLGISTLGVDVITILEFYYLIISLIPVFLILTNKKINNREFFIDAIWIFLTISLFNMYAVVFKNEDILRYSFYGDVDFLGMMKIASILLGIRFIIKNLENKRDRKKNTIEAISLVLFGIIICALKIDNEIRFKILILVNIYCIAILVNIIKMDKKIKGEDSKNINYIKVYIIMFFIRNCLILINNFMSNKIWFIEYVSINLTFIATSILAVYMLGKIINSPYSEARSRLIISNKAVRDLNENLEFKNNEIDCKRAVIKEIEKAFKGFFRNIPMATIIINSNRGNIVYVNKPGVSIFGENKISDLIGKNFMGFIKMIKDEEFEKISSKAYIAEIRKNGKKVAIQCEEKKLDEAEEILLITDLTSKVECLNIENIIKEKKLKEDMKRKFLSNISHDLKTPINVIYSSAQVQDIYLFSENTKELENYKNISKQNALWLRRLTNNIIDISKIELDFLGSKMLTKENIVSFVEDIFSGLVQYAREENIEMIFDTDTEEILIDFNRDYMERIMLNLVSNAIKYNKENGSINLNIESNSKYVYIKIKDSGIGIKEEFLEDIFKRYTKEGNRDQGMFKSSGIGMYVVKKLVEEQNGKIYITSEYGKGTEIIIRFSRGI